MGKSKKWGDKSISLSTSKDLKAKKEIMEQLQILGETGHKDKKSVIACNKLHEMNPSWQPISATSFRNAVWHIQSKLSKFRNLKFSSGSNFSI